MDAQRQYATAGAFASGNNPQLAAMLASDQQFNVAKITPAIPRALESQDFAGKRLIEAAQELLKRLEPVLAPEPEGACNQCGESKATCPLSEQIDRGTSDMNVAAGIVNAILRRLAL